jgi:predicted DNA-binding protein
MAVDLAPDTERRLRALADESGRAAEKIAEDALAGYLDELTDLRSTLDRRYDELKSGSVQLLDGEDVRREMKSKTQAQRSSR